VTRQEEPTAAAALMHAWCRAVLRHLSEAAGEPLPFMEGMADNLDRALARGDERGLKMVAGDLREWASGLSRSRFEVIDKDLAARFGVGLADEQKVARRVVEKILRRGSVGDDDEYRALKVWLDATDAGEQRQVDVDAVRTLLVDYELRHWNGR